LAWSRPPEASWPARAMASRCPPSSSSTPRSQPGSLPRFSRGCCSAGMPVARLTKSRVVRLNARCGSGARGSARHACARMAPGDSPGSWDGPPCASATRFLLRVRCPQCARVPDGVHRLLIDRHALTLDIGLALDVEQAARDPALRAERAHRPPLRRGDPRPARPGARRAARPPARQDPCRDHRRDRRRLRTRAADCSELRRRSSITP
jgi:hypothetical protein